jgi:hypothetical protein
MPGAASVTMGMETREPGGKAANRTQSEDRDEEPVSHDYTLPAPAPR